MEYRTALITGASSGIGAGIARRLANGGVTVVLCARREVALQSLATDIRAAGGTAHVRVVDMNDGDAAAAAVRAADDELGGIDLVIANAGVGVTGPAPSWESAREMCHVNFTGAIATLTAVLPRMLERRRGHLVGVSSLAALAPLPTSSVYAATKAGLTMFLSSLQIDLRGTGVHATVVHPGFVRTAMTAVNKFRMPFLMETDVAVDRILSRLPDHPARIDFPLPTAAALHVAALLPASVLAYANARIRRHG
ncbi:MAG: SDR family NAD(P)-dependent oxidoreductase [Deltaproteobacteria bacterium]